MRALWILVIAISAWGQVIDRIAVVVGKTVITETEVVGYEFEARFRPNQPLTEEEQAVLGKPVSDLNLSVRARKCMNRLGINTLGELIQRSADELLESKNFGMTSLNEVREKFAQLGLTLRGD